MKKPPNDAPQSRPGASAIPERLKRATRAARTVELREELAHQRAHELLRWSSPSAAASASWRLWALAGAALAAVAIVVLFGRSALQDGAKSGFEGGGAAVTQVGPRVAVVPSGASEFAVVRASEGETVIEVSRGAITARLWPGAAPHRLILRTDGLEASALGTTFSLIKPSEGRANVVVHHGAVELRDAQGLRVLKAQSAPVDRALRASVELLARHTPRAPKARTSIVSPRPQSASKAAKKTPSLGDRPKSVSRKVMQEAQKLELERPSIDGGTQERAEAAPEASVVLWRRARLLRGQGKYEASVALLRTLAERADPTWSPLAWAEMIRVYERLAQPARVVDKSALFLERYKDHNLVPEVRQLACGAYEQLKKSAPAGLCSAAVPK